MISFPQLYTEKLLLRKIEIDDIPLLVKYANNKKISDYILNIPYPYYEPDAVFRIREMNQGFKTNTKYAFAIILRENDSFIGEISLFLDQKKDLAELGYWIGETFWNKGIITEAIAAIVKFGFEKLNLDMIYATCMVNNIGSVRVLEKNGFSKTNTQGTILQYTIKKE